MTTTTNHRLSAFLVGRLAVRGDFSWNLPHIWTRFGSPEKRSVEPPKAAIDDRLTLIRIRIRTIARPTYLDDVLLGLTTCLGTNRSPASSLHARLDVAVCCFQRLLPPVLSILYPQPPPDGAIMKRLCRYPTRPIQPEKAHVYRHVRARPGTRISWKRTAVLDQADTVAMSQGNHSRHPTALDMCSADFGLCHVIQISACLYSYSQQNKPSTKDNGYLPFRVHRTGNPDSKGSVVKDFELAPLMARAKKNALRFALDKFYVFMSSPEHVLTLYIGACVDAKYSFEKTPSKAWPPKEHCCFRQHGQLFRSHGNFFLTPVVISDQTYPTAF